ncbi:MAG: DUF2291 domain-containing protein [Bryobacterales bacterium]|nr:DUF2291 domain-containing protein [Bryobacterales bacterium]
MTGRRAILLVALLWLPLASCVPWTVRPIASEQGAADPATQTAAAYVDSIWAAKLVPAVRSAAVEARTLLDALATAPTEALARYGHREGGGPAYYIVKGRGVVLEVDRGSRTGLALIDVAPLDGKADVSIQIGPVLRGVSLRDATGIVRFSDFVNQLQFADVGNELNDRVVKTVLAPLDTASLEGCVVAFAGTLAAEESAAPPLRDLVPVELTVEERR